MRVVDSCNERQQLAFVFVATARQRDSRDEGLDPVGSGFSASPVAVDGKIYLTSEDGEMFVIAAGREFKQLATNSLGELVMPRRRCPTE
jgi:PQQ-like domain